MVKNYNVKSNAKISESTLWTSTPENWTKLSLEDIDIEKALQKYILELKQQSPELKKMIAVFDTPFNSELLFKTID